MLSRCGTVAVPVAESPDGLDAGVRRPGQLAAQPHDTVFDPVRADPERIVGNLHRACAELAGTPRGGPIDMPAALADMVAYNGGAPLTCLA